MEGRYDTPSSLTKPIAGLSFQDSRQLDEENSPLAPDNRGGLYNAAHVTQV